MGIYVWLLFVVNCAILAGVCYQRLPNPISGVLQKLPVVDGIDAVSYTHLDVYKRQNLFLLNSPRTFYMFLDIIPSLTIKYDITCFNPYWFQYYSSSIRGATEVATHRMSKTR